MPEATNEISCKELVELITDYLEEAVPPAVRARFEEHLAACDGCQTYLQQMRQTLAAVGSLKEESIPAEARQKLLEAFRNFPSGRETRKRDVPLGIGEQFATPGDHIAFFWEDERDFAAAISFLEVGLWGKDFCLVFGHDAANQKIVDSLWNKGLDVAKLIQQQRLVVLGGNPNAKKMLENIGGVFQNALASGASLLRLLGNIGWGRENWPEDDDILEFEATVSEAAKQFPAVIVCMYDVRALAGRILLKGGFETHPLTVHGHVLRENPFYVPVVAFLSRLRAVGPNDRVTG